MDEGKIRKSEPTIPERAKTCAIRYKGQIFTGKTHYDASMLLEKAFPDYDIFDTEEGYITNRNRFIDLAEFNEIEEELEKTNPKINLI